MASGPDPNRDLPTERDLSDPAELAAGGGLGDLRSTRLGLSSGTIVVLLLIGLAVLVGFYFLRR